MSLVIVVKSCLSTQLYSNLQDFGLIGVRHLFNRPGGLRTSSKLPRDITFTTLTADLEAYRELKEIQFMFIRSIQCCSWDGIEVRRY
jgi:hypothetical protein